MLHSLLTAYWFEGESPPHYGVTAYSLDDARRLLDEAGFDVSDGTWLVLEGVRVAELDQNHVVPNMGVIVRRGVWYPNFNSSS